MKYLLITLVATAHLSACAQNVAPTTPPRSQSLRGGGGVAGTSQSPAPAGVASSGYATSSGVATVARNVNTLRSYRDTIPPVQIRFSAADNKVTQEMEEDLATMGVLIDQAIDQPQTAMGIDMVLTSSTVRAMYVEGSGALYMLKASFPMFGSASGEDKVEEKSTNSEWDKARDAVRGTSGTYAQAKASTDVPFDPAQVEALRKVIVNAMKHGANFRHLKGDEYFSVAVFGQPSPQQMYVQQNKSSNSNNNTTLVWATSGRSEPGTVMTLQVRKSDMDAHAKGSLDAAAFAAKVKTTTYAGGGHDITSVNSWLRNGTAPLRLR